MIPRLNRLNGWRRLWLVIALLWLAAVAWLTFDELPSRRLTAIAREIAQEQEQYRKAYVQGLPMNHGFDPFADGQAIPTELAERLEAKYSARRAEAGSKTNAEAVLHGGLLGLIPPVAIYVLGAAVAWIRAGFARKIGVSERY